MSRLFQGIKTARYLLSTNVQTHIPRFFKFMGIFVGIFYFNSNSSCNINMFSQIFYPVGDASFPGSAIIPGVNSGVNRRFHGSEGYDLRSFLFGERRFYFICLNTQGLDVAGRCRR